MGENNWIIVVFLLIVICAEMFAYIAALDKIKRQKEIIDAMHKRIAENAYSQAYDIWK